MKTLVSVFLIISGYFSIAQINNMPADKMVSEYYSFQTVKSSECYLNKTGDYIFYSEPDFIDFCNATFGLDSKIPFIDFNQETAVVIFNSLKKSTAKLFVDNVVETEHFIKINVKTSEPTNDAVNATLRNQYIIVKVKKSNKEINVTRL